MSMVAGRPPQRCVQRTWSLGVTPLKELVKACGMGRRSVTTVARDGGRAPIALWLWVVWRGRLGVVCGGRRGPISHSINQPLSQPKSNTTTTTHLPRRVQRVLDLGLMAVALQVGR